MGERTKEGLPDTWLVVRGGYLSGGRQRVVGPVSRQRAKRSVEAGRQERAHGGFPMGGVVVGLWRCQREATHD